MTNPVLGFVRTCLLFILNRVSFDRSVKGKKLHMDDGKVFTVFRRVTIRSGEKAGPGAVFLVRFKPKNMTPEENIRFSRLPMMIFMGFTGFRSKYWAVDFATGLCQGLYEWQTVRDAENYAGSIAMRFMSRRSDPESVEYRIIDNEKDEFHFSLE